MIRILISLAFGALLGAAALGFALLYSPWGDLWPWEPAGAGSAASPSSADVQASESPQPGDASEANATSGPSAPGDAKEADPPRIDRFPPAEPLIEIDRFVEAPRSPEPGRDESPPVEGRNPHPPEEQPDEAPAAGPRQRPVDYQELGDRIFEVAEALDRFKDKLRQSTEWENAEEGEPPPPEPPEAVEAAGVEEVSRDEEPSRGDSEIPSRSAP